MEPAAAMGSGWSAAARQRAELQEEKSRPLWEAMLDAAAVGPGVRLLDAGCGAGGGCLLAYARGAEVDGFDIAEGMIRVARERLPEGSFRVGDMQALSYGDAEFDVVLAANSIQFADDPAAAIRELRRVCRPGGRVVIGVWGRDNECQYLDLLRSIYRLLPSPPDIVPPARLSAPGVLAAIAEEAGLRVISEGAADCPFAYPDDDTFWRALGSSGIQVMVARAVGEGPMKAAMFAAVARYRRLDGTIRMENRMRYLAATPG